ncbi:MAG: hypothetical protein K9M96_13080 [Deltaproteobacteria bacterium]|nr:hypothetical protein [Deltaproteobacteria bacterium]
MNSKNLALSVRLFGVLTVFCLVMPPAIPRAAFAQTLCTDAMIWAVFPTSKDLPGVNDQLLNKNGPTVNSDGTRSFAKRWSAGSVSRSVNITLTEYPDTKTASQKVHAYGFDDQKGQVRTGRAKLSFGDEGYKTDDVRRPYYLVHRGQFTVSYYTSYPGRSGGIPGDQDPTVEKIIQKIAALPCLGATVTPPPPPPPAANQCPRISLKASPVKAGPSQTITLTAQAADPEGDDLKLKWSVTDAQGRFVNVAWNGKVVTGTGKVQDTISWKPPSPGQYTISASVSDGKCGKTEKASTQVLVQAGMNVSVNTDKTTYTPGETVKIQGRVWNDQGGLGNATVKINVDGTILTATTGLDGTYEKAYPISSSAGPKDVKVMVTASHPGYADTPGSTRFRVGPKALLVTITTENQKAYYLAGEKINYTVTVTDGIGNPFSNAELKVTATRLGSKRPLGYHLGNTDQAGKYANHFIWDTLGVEGKLEIEVTAADLGLKIHQGYAPGKNSITLSGCGDGVLQCPNPNKYCENCANCPEDCPCKPGEICDPLNEKGDKQTGCSPKTAVIFTTNADPHYTWYHQWVASNELAYIKGEFKKKKYDIKTVNLKGTLVYIPKEQEEVWIPDSGQIAKYLARPSTKAIAFFGHGGSCIKEDPKTYIPSLGGDNIANKLQRSVMEKTALNYQKLYKMDYTKARSKAVSEIMDPNWDCGLDMAYIHACHSLNDHSLLNLLVRKRGTYWGDEGILNGVLDLDEVVKP